MVFCLEMYLKTKRLKLIDESDPVFHDFYYVLDNEMKRKTKLGLGAVKSASPISSSMEEKMWVTGVLGEENGTQLCETIIIFLVLT